jgi:WD40 repeat protein
MWHADGTPVLDADGTERTPGDFTTLGSYYAPGATIADLDLNGTWEIICPTWDSKTLYVFEADGSLLDGFPVLTNSASWSSAAAGNIDADPQLEIVFSSNDNKIFAYNYDGSEVINGDGDLGTTGVFKIVSQPFNYGSPALADLDNDGRQDVILAGFDGFLYAWRGDGTNLPGFPVNMFAGTTASPAVGDIDNDGQLEIAVTTNNSKLNVYNANGTIQAGFPVTGVAATGVSRLPSPIFADMEGVLGEKDIVINTTDGFVKVFRPNGTIIPAWSNVRYTALMSGASECSPIAADIDGDGQNEILVGGEDANLSAFDNNGTLMAGFPIKLNGEVRGSPLAFDLDHDGLTEIAVAGWDKNVYVWDYPGTYCPTGPPAWTMWRHDQFRTGRLTSPVVVATNGIAFSAQSAQGAGITLSFAMPSAADAGGQYDLFRAAGEGPTSDVVYALPTGFERISREPLSAAAGELVSWTDAGALPGSTYRYLLVRRATQPGQTFFAYGPFAAQATSDAPARAYLAQSFPNPAPSGRASAIAYGIPGAPESVARVVVRMYDVRGRAVRTLVDELVPPGRYQAVWDGNDDFGRRVTPGMYFYELVAGADRLTKKALVIAP